MASGSRAGGYRPPRPARTRRASRGPYPRTREGGSRRPLCITRFSAYLSWLWWPFPPLWSPPLSLWWPPPLLSPPLLWWLLPLWLPLLCLLLLCVFFGQCVRFVSP